MSTSIHKGIVDFATSLYGAANDPLDTAIVRDGIANGLLHCADECGQVRVNYMPIAAAVENGQKTFETIESSPTVDTWYSVGAAPFGEWPLTLRWDAVPYLLRLRVGVAASASNSDKLTLRVVIAPYGDGIRERDRLVDHVWETSWTASDTGTTPTWATGATLGSDASATLLTVSRTQADAWRRTVSTYDAVSAAEPVAVDQCLVAAWAFAQTGGTALPRLHALHIQEYLGT